MNPALLVALLVAALLALLPLWPLRRAGWPSSWLQTAWLVLAGLVLLALVAPATARVVLPVVFVLAVLPFALGADRLARLARRAERAGGVVIDVTPRSREDTTATTPQGPAAGPPPGG